MNKIASVFCRLYRESFWRPLVGLLLFVGLAGFAEAAGGIVANDLSSETYAVVIDSFGRIVTAGSAYRQFQIDHLTRIKGVQNVKSEIPMQKIKLTSELPL